MEPEHLAPPRGTFLSRSGNEPRSGSTYVGEFRGHECRFDTSARIYARGVGAEWSSGGARLWSLGFRGR